MNTFDITSHNAFENICNVFYSPIIKRIHANIEKGKSVFPSLGQQKKTIEFINRKTIGGDYRLVVNLKKETIEPLFHNDEQYPFNTSMNSKSFFKKIHISYLIPYFVYSDFAYELAADMKNIDRETILSMNYLIQIPLRINRNDNRFSWYLQESRALTLNENNQLLSHVNTYKLIGSFFQGKKPHYNLIEGLIVQNNLIKERFRNYFNKRLCSYYRKHVFSHSQMEALYGRKEKGNSLNSLKRDILSNITKNSGYNFKSFDCAKEWLAEIGFFENNDNATLTLLG